MTKSKKIDRPTLIRKIVKNAALPPSKKSTGYFTRDQLVELCLYLDSVVQKASNLDTLVIGDKTNDAEGTAEKA